MWGRLVQRRHPCHVTCMCGKWLHLIGPAKGRHRWVSLKTDVNYRCVNFTLCDVGWRPTCESYFCFSPLLSVAEVTAAVKQQSHPSVLNVGLESTTAAADSSSGGWICWQCDRPEPLSLSPFLSFSLKIQKLWWKVFQRVFPLHRKWPAMEYFAFQQLSDIVKPRRCSVWILNWFWWFHVRFFIVHA